MMAFRNVRVTRETFEAAPLDVAPLVPKTSKTAAAPVATSPSGPVDSVLAAALVFVIFFGVVMVYSASNVLGATRHHDPEFFLTRQLMYAGGALALLFGLSRIDYHRLYKATYAVLLGTGGLLTACIAGLGHSGGGATRWIAIGPVHIQPAEIAKLAIVVWLAYSLAKKAEAVKSFTVGFLPHLLVAGLFMVLCMKQPDFGSAVVLLLLTFAMLFVAGARVGYILGAAILGSLFAVVSVLSKSYRMQRYEAWMHLEQNRQGIGYQPYQSVMSYGSGGFFGHGIGRGTQTMFLPEAHTDFISAIIGEELGYIGICGLILLYLLIVARGVRTALRAPDDYGAYLAYGISFLFGIQAVFNLCVALSLLPTKGLTLPFLSFGGSSLLVNAAAAGILLNISRQGPVEVAPEDAPTPRPTEVRRRGKSADVDVHEPEPSLEPGDVEALS